MDIKSFDQKHMPTQNHPRPTLPTYVFLPANCGRQLAHYLPGMACRADRDDAASADATRQYTMILHWSRGGATLVFTAFWLILAQHFELW